MSDGRRASCLGNALVAGIPHVIGRDCEGGFVGFGRLVRPCRQLDFVPNDTNTALAVTHVGGRSTCDGRAYEVEVPVLVVAFWSRKYVGAHQGALRRAGKTAFLTVKVRIHSHAATDKGHEIQAKKTPIYLGRRFEIYLITLQKMGVHASAGWLNML